VLELKPPLVLLSGPAGFGEYLKLIDHRFVGAVVLKTVTFKPRGGNPPPRIAEGPFFLLNSIGLENPGVLSFLEDLPKLAVPTIASFGGETYEEYLEIAKLVKDKAKEFVAVEFNFSCPNVKEGGLTIVRDKEKWRRLLVELREILDDSFLIAKVGIEGLFVEDAAEMAFQAGWNGMTLVNTVRGLIVDKGKILLGGLSGPILKPIALRAVYEVKRRFPNLYVIGSGGVYSVEDAKDYLMVGADAIGIGSALFKDPGIVEEIGRYLLEVRR